MRPKLPRPNDTAAPGGQVLAPDGSAGQRDPKLDDFAEMQLVIATGFGLGTDGMGAVYDSAQHRYLPAYLHGPLGLGLNAQPGLKRASKSTSQTSAAGGAGPADPIDALAERLKTAPPDLASLMSLRTIPPVGSGKPPGGGLAPEPQDPRLPPPKGLTAYDWVVSTTGWSKHLIMQNPTRADTITGLTLPGPGKYDVRMRVWFGSRFTEKTVSFSVREKVIVGIGDSFASGQGNPDHWADIDRTDPRVKSICGNPTVGYASGLTPPTKHDAIWYEKKAHRSFYSGQAMAALSLQNVSGATWSEDSGPTGLTQFDFTKVTFASFARSGATIRGSLLAPQGGFGDMVGAGQIEEFRRTFAGRPIDALLISIGGNDAGFAGVLEDLVTGDSVYNLTGGKFGTDPNKVRAKLDFLLGVGLSDNQKGPIESDLETLRTVIDNNLRPDVPIGQVYLSGYPVDLFYVGDDGQYRYSACEIFDTQSGWLSISQPEAAEIKKYGQILNNLLARKANNFGWHFVDVAPDFAGNGYCRNDAKAMWVTAGKSCYWQGDFDGTMHPNARGHTAYALRYAEQLNKYSP